MSFIAVAIGGSALIGGVASIVGGNRAAGAQTRAADQSTALQREQDAEARRQYDLNRSDLAPYRQAGTAALGRLSNAMGIRTSPQTTDWGGYVRNNPAALAAYNAANQGTIGNWTQDGWEPSQAPQSIEEFGQQYYNSTGQAAGDDISAYGPQDDGDFGSLDRSFTLADFNRDPGYEFRRGEGQRGVENSASARGGILSGGALRAIARYNSDFASGEYGAAYNRFNNDQTTRFNRLSAIAGTGQTATSEGIAAGNQLTGQLQQGVNNITNNIGNAANARASAYVNTGNAIAGAAGQVGNYFALRDLYRAPGGGGLTSSQRAAFGGV